MRYLGMLVLVCGCSGGTIDTRPADAQHVDAQPVDAMPDADLCTNMPVTGCVFNGLASQPFDGVTPWTLTGTVANFGQAMPLTATLYINRQGCALTITSATYGNGDLSITDTRAVYAVTGEYPHPHTYSAELCLADATSSLHYTSHNMITMPPQDQMIDGVLTH